jgi:hypothetical protein
MALRAGRFFALKQLKPRCKLNSRLCWPRGKGRMLPLISVRLNSQLPSHCKRVQTASGLLPNWLPPHWLSIPSVFALTLVPNPAALADALQDCAKQCYDAIGVTVPDFDCDAGTEVPGQGSVFSGNQPGVTCGEPNRLNRQCDPGSRFQVLTRSNDAYVVAHCRKEGGESGEYGDIAVIQYSRKNGATCFYQALGDQNHGNLPGGHTAPIAPAKVLSPSKGQVPNTFWMSPSGTANIGCGGCHDNGPFIRSPYLNQVTCPNKLPGSDDFSFNRIAISLTLSLARILLRGKPSRSRSLLATNATIAIAWASTMSGPGRVPRSTSPFARRLNLRRRRIRLPKLRRSGCPRFRCRSPSIRPMQTPPRPSMIARCSSSSVSLVHLFFRCRIRANAASPSSRGPTPGNGALLLANSNSTQVAPI